MKALVYNGVGKIDLEERPKSTIKEPEDAVIKLNRTTICGTDLHIIKGDVPSVDKGRVLGHEGIGYVDAVGDAVKKFKVGDHVLIACITSCGSCTFCRKGTQGFCDTGGWQLGHLLDGTQAEYVRIKHADASLHHFPEGMDERSALVLSDIIPTGHEVGALRAGVKPGATVAIVGAGPVGLAALLTSKLYSPGAICVVDRDDSRLEKAKRMGATHTVNPTKGSGDVKEMTKELHGEVDGFDCVIEAVGVPQTFELCCQLVGKGGSIANIGVHGEKVELRMDLLWGRGFTLSSALVDTSTLTMLLKLYEAGKLDTSEMVTHDYKFSDILKAYDTFSNAADTKALKLNIEMD